ncbi:MAG: tetratricopeptide repeat protein [Saprospiraceae bacterium]
MSENIIEKLKARRFFPLFGSYLLGGWAMIQFVEWLSAKYDLSPLWSEVVLLSILIMIPAAILVIYKHGAPGYQNWSKLEMIGIPLNLLLAIALIFIRTSSLPATEVQGTKVIKAVDEAGQAVSRVVPEVSNTKRIALFPFVNKSDQADLNWMRFALPALMDIDLEQDSRLHGQNGINFNDRYQTYDQSLDQDISFALQRNIAEDEYTDLFVQGNFSKQGDDWTIETKVFTTSDGKEFYNNTFTGPDFYKLVDEFTIDFKENLQLADIQTSKNLMVDLPADGIISAKPDALKNYFESQVAVQVENTPTKAVMLMESALELDPNCTECHHFLSWIYARMGLGQKAKDAVQTAMSKSGHLPERQKLAIKNLYYRANNEIEKAIALNDMWRKFYPNDYKPYSNLFQYYISRAEFDEAIAIGEEALKVGHTGDILLMLSQLENLAGRPQNAIEYMEEFQKKFPSRLKETSTLSDIYVNEGNFEKAEAHLEKLLLMEPANIKLLRDLAYLKIKTGEFDKAEKYINDALRQSKNAKDSVFVIYVWEELYLKMGKSIAAIDLLRKRHQLQLTYSTPIEIQYDFMSFSTMENFIEAGKLNIIEEEIKFFTENKTPAYEIMKCACNLNYYLAVKDLANFNVWDDKCREEIIKVQGPSVFLMIDAFKLEMQGDYKKAIEMMNKCIETLNVNSIDFNIPLIGMYRKDGQLQKAKELLENTMKSNPVNAKLYVEMAKIEKGLSNNAGANEWLDKALEVWKDADAVFKPVVEAKQLKDQYTM